VCSIHQPRAAIFHLFHRVLILQKGNNLFLGSPHDTEDYFRS
jgi:ABC-type multidrug transport system ATPase subunit